MIQELITTEWFSLLSPNEKALLIGTGANFAGGLAGSVVRKMLSASASRIRKKYGKPSDPIQEALNLVMARALYLAARQSATDPDDPDRRWHIEKIYGAWLERENVNEELSKLLEPSRDSILDEELLESEFKEIGAVSEWISKRVAFKEILGRFIKSFYVAVAGQELMKSVLEIQFLKFMADNCDIQTDLQRRIAERVAPDLSSDWRSYYAQLIEKTMFIAFQGTKRGGSDARICADNRVALPDVYIHLNTTATKDSPEDMRKEGASFRRERPLSAIEAFGSNSIMVLTGDPGSGKTTFINHLCFCLASYHSSKEKNWLDRIRSWPREWSRLIPVRIELRHLAYWAVKEGKSFEEAGLLTAYLKHSLRSMTVEGIYSELRQALRDGKGLVMLDGLDEVPDSETLRPKIKKMISLLPTAMKGCPILVTCRVRSYRQDDWRLDGPEWSVFELKEMDGKQISDFISAWYNHLSQKSLVPDPESNISDLQEAVQKKGLRHLAGNPLLLTVMAIDHADKGRLPHARALLYEDVAGLLLWEWDSLKERNAEERISTWRKVLDEGQVQETDIMRAFRQLAFDVHDQMPKEAGPESTADISREQLIGALAAVHPKGSRDWADRLVQVIGSRAGLLVEGTPGFYTFPHRTFQEYLAGCHLGALPDYSEQAIRRAGRGDLWWEAIPMSVGRLVHDVGDMAKPIMLIGELCGGGEPNKKDKGAWRNIWLAAKCLEEAGAPRIEGTVSGKETGAKVRERIRRLVEKGLFDAKEREEAAAILGRLGDPRPGVGCVDGLPDITWVNINGGQFTMGTDPKKDPDAYEDEYEQFPCSLIRSPYRISRYPVTVAQFEPFVREKGYENPEFWTKVGWDWRREEGIQGPENYGEHYELDNHPRVGISFHEAVAYCNWLSTKPGSEGITLPTEAQWERAARGTDGRIYPWGNTFDEGRCNSFETRIMHTSAVGLFDSLNPECRIADMAGNVWEWCLTEWRDNYKEYEQNVNDDPEGEVRRVLRGGAFYSTRRLMRCAYRYGLRPSDRDDLVGFRLVAPLHQL